MLAIVALVATLTRVIDQPIVPRGRHDSALQGDFRSVRQGLERTHRGRSARRADAGLTWPASCRGRAHQGRRSRAPGGPSRCRRYAWVMKLLLSSFGPSPSHDAALAELVGKPLGDMRVGYIENAHDPYHDEASLEQGREDLRRAGYVFDLVDLRTWRHDRVGLARLLGTFDAFLLAGGNPYHLRSLMHITGADVLISGRVRAGVVYAGASAAAVVAGPTLRHFDELDDPAEAETLIWEGLGLTQTVIAPHVDNTDFGEGCRTAGDLCERDGYTVQRLTDAQALVIDGDTQRVVEP